MVGLFWIEKVKEWFVNSWWSFANSINYRFIEYNDNIDRCAFFEELNYGWYQMYIYPYDDMYHPTISDERKKWLGGFPQQYTFYVSEEEFDSLMAKTNRIEDIIQELYQRKLK